MAPICELQFSKCNKTTMSFNMILGLIAFVYMGNAFQRERKRFCVKIVAYPFGYPTIPIVNEPIFFLETMKN